MHNDEPTLLDKLGHRKMVYEVGDSVANCLPPQVFGVHGDCGLGKTSLAYPVYTHTH